MEEILAKLLVSDNTVILQATEELKEAFKNPDVIPALCNVVGSSQNYQIRQYAAVLLRKKLAKSKSWMKLTVQVRDGIKTGILQALVNEPEKVVKNSIAQFIGVIVKHEFSNQTWPEILQFIQQLNVSDNIADKELGMYTLSVISEISYDQFLTHTTSLAALFTNNLNTLTPENLASPLSYYTLITMLHFVPLTVGDQALVNSYHQLMPRTLQITKAMSQSNELYACEVMQLFEELLDTSIAIVVPHVKPLVTMCLEFANNNALGDDLRVKALNLVGFIIRSKKKSILKNNLLDPILAVLFPLMSLCPEDEESEEYFADENDDNTPATIATQTLDLLALHLPPDKLIPKMLPYIEAGLRGTNPYSKKASYLTIAVVAEGCTEYIRTKYLETFIECICLGIQETTGIVRNAALFALGQFSEHLQPEISLYAPKLLPILFEYLTHLCSQLQTDGKPTPGVERMFYALEMFCENLDEKLLPYLPVLLDRLLTTLNPNNSIHIRELALSAIGATASSAKEGLIPYFPRIIEHIKCYLTLEQTDETMILKTQALDALAVCIRSVGAETFLPLAKETIDLALSLLKETDEPDIRKSAFGLLGAISSVANDQLAPILPEIIELMIHSMKSTEGIVPHYKEEETNFSVYEDLEESAEEEDIENESDEDDDSVAGYSVANAYIEEKEEACMALKEIAKCSGPAFQPYLERSFEEAFKLVNYPQEDIRIAAIAALTQFCTNFYEINTIEGQIALQKALSIFIPKCAELVRTDEERSVAISALDAFSELLSSVKGAVIEGNGHKEAILNCIKDVMTYKTECQDADDADGGDSDDPDAEHDEILIESAGNVVPNLGKVLSNEEFAQHFTVLLPLFTNRTKKNCSVAQRSFSIGTLSESVKPLGEKVIQFLPQLLPLFIHMSKDEHNEVRHNSIYGIGELALNGREHLFSSYPEILQTLSGSASKEDNPGTLDNICGALAKLMIVNSAGVPMEQVFPVFVNYLPLREDFEENTAVYQCIAHLYSQGHPILLKHLAPVVHACLLVYHEKQGDLGTLGTIGQLLQLVHRDFPEVFNSVVSTLPVEINASVQQIFSG